jgi:hypothetical protein
MTKRKQPMTGGADAPEWFISLLKAARASREFQKRCKEAGALALHIDRLRTANRARAHERISLAERVTKLARSAKVPLAPVLAWFGIEEMSLADSDASLASFGHELGFTKEGLMESIQIGARGFVVAQARRGARKQPNDAGWDRQTLERFRSLREAIDAAYDSPEFED